MADTKAIRRRIEEQIRALQDKLRAVELVEQAAAELGVDGERPSKALMKPSTDGTFADHSIAEACKHIVIESDKTWTAINVLEEIKRRGKPGATREAVSVALRRLAGSGVLEARRSRNRKKGQTYRSKTIRESVSSMGRPPFE